MTTEKASAQRGWCARHNRLLSGVGATLLVALVVGGYFAEMYWPYRYRNVKPLLEGVFASKVTIGHYTRIYFPHPGFVAKEITLRRNSAPDLPPIGSIHDLVVQGTWIDLLLLRKRVSLVDVVRLHVVVPALGSRAMHEDFPAGSSADFIGPSTIVEELRVHTSVLDLMRRDGSRYSYPIREAVIQNLRQGQAFSYALDMDDAQPKGRIVARGKFGPIPPKNLGATPLRGDFTFAPVDLGTIGELHGTLRAVGRFSGRLSDIQVQAQADTPDFSVSDGTPVPVNGQVRCTLNGLNGNIVLNNVDAKMRETPVEAQGTIMGSPRQTDVDLTVRDGRAQDLLQPFLQDEPPIAGAVWLKAHAHLDPDGHGVTFFHRLHVDARFDVPEERMTVPALEQKLTSFSERAQGAKESKKPEDEDRADVLSSVGGPAKIQDGVASTAGLTFEMPGAGAKMKGWYDFRDGAAHLDGNLWMKTDISHAETGFKSVLLKPLAPFFKKKKAGAVVPIAVTGKPGHYKVSSNLLHEK